MTISEELNEAIRSFAKAVTDLYKAISRWANSVCPALQKVIEYSKIPHYAPKRLVYLALHAKKRRVRKKNWNRILKLAEASDK